MSGIETLRAGSVLTVTLNNAERGNALTEPSLIDAFVAALTQAGADDAVKAVIVTGASGIFSAGGDIDDITGARGMFGGAPAEIRMNYRRGIHRLILALHGLEVPTIAAVNGAAVGAGFDLALACDIRLAATGARFRTGFTALGLVPGDGGAWLLREAVGPAIAARLILTSDTIDADEAMRLGLVSDVVAEAELPAAASSLAGRIAIHPSAALRLSKRLLRRAATQSFADAVEDAAAAQALCHHDADHRAIVSRIAEDRRRQKRP